MLAFRESLNPSAFARSVWQACSRIPLGRVGTYAGIAKAIGKPKAARAVGQALNRSPGMPSVPCHRVVRSDGKLGGFALGKKEKARLLAVEGVRVKNDRIAGFESVLWPARNGHG